MNKERQERIKQLVDKLHKSMADKSPEKLARAKADNDKLPKYPTGDTSAVFYKRKKN